MLTADLVPVSGRPSLSPASSWAGRSLPASLTAALCLRERSLPSMFLRQVSRRLVACSSSPLRSFGKKYSCSARRLVCHLKLWMAGSSVVECPQHLISARSWACCFQDVTTGKDSRQTWARIRPWLCVIQQE